MKHQHSYISATNVIKIFLSSILILLILDFIGKKIISSNFFQSDNSVHNIFKKNKSDLIIFGSSTTARALDPDILDRKLGTNGYTFASDGTGIFYAVSLLRQIPQNEKLKYVIFGIDPLSFVSGYSSNNFKQIERLAPYAKKDPVLMNFLRIDDKWIDIKMISLTYPYISQFKEILKDKARNFINNENYKNKKNFRALNGSLIKKSKQKEIKINFTNNENFLKISDEGIYVLELIKEEINKRNVKLVIITTPIYNTKLRSLQSKNKNIMMKIRSVLESENFCDLTNLENKKIKEISQDPVNFFDEPHLNSLGAEKFSIEIAKAISLDCKY
tara:strand:- start:859 stop:1848 length:990 start_codon:yes stop_codon:yes gene_type:complete